MQNLKKKLKKWGKHKFFSERQNKLNKLNTVCPSTANKFSFASTNCLNMYNRPSEDIAIKDTNAQKK